MVNKIISPKFLIVLYTYNMNYNVVLESLKPMTDINTSFDE